MARLIDSSAIVVDLIAVDDLSTAAIDMWSIGMSIGVGIVFANIILARIA